MLFKVVIIFRIILVSFNLGDVNIFEVLGLEIIDSHTSSV